MPKITSMHAYIMADKNEYDEGIPAFSTPDGMMFPLVGADEERMKSLRPMAEELAKRTGKSIRLVKFTAMEEVETIQGDSNERERNNDSEAYEEDRS